MATVLDEVFTKSYSKLNLGNVADPLLDRIISNAEDAEDFEENIRKDKFLTEKVLTDSSNLLKMGTVKSISHAVVLLGKDTLRDFVLWHSIRRKFEKDADSDISDIKSAGENLKKAHRAHDIAKANHVEQLGLAYVSGLLFDVFDQWAKHSEIDEEGLAFINSTWEHSIRTAGIAWGLVHQFKLNLALKRLIFSAGLLHDIGKIILFLMYPERYKPLIEKMKWSEDERTYSERNDDIIWERDEFGITHVEVGSLILSGLASLDELEGVLDYHHNFAILKKRHKDLYFLLNILRLSDDIALFLAHQSQLEVDYIVRSMKDLEFPSRLDAPAVHALVMTLRSKNAIV